MKTKIKKIFLSLFWLSLVIVLINCPNPVPTLSLLTPDTKVYHMPEFTLTATGTDFSSDTVIVFDGIQKTTVFVSSTELNCQIYPQDIAIGGASLQVVVRDTVSGNESNTLYFRVEQVHTFSGPVRASSSLSQYCPITRSAKIAVDYEKNVNVVWEEGQPPDGEGYVYFIRSEDLGLTWINSQEIPQPANLGNFYPAIAVDRSLNINIVYAKQTTSDGTYDLYFLRSQEGEGIHWTVPLNVTSGYTSYAKYSDIKISEYNNVENIAVVFNSYMWSAQCDIYFVHSSNSGASWSLPVKVNDTAEHSRLERMAVDTGGEIYVVWLDNISGTNSKETFFNHSPDFGATWGNPMLLSYNPVEFRYPDVEVGEPGCVYAVWVEQKGDNNIYTVSFRHSDDDGNTWTAPVSLAENSSNSMQAVIAADTAGNVNLYYYNSDGCFFRRSIDRGRNWEPAISMPLPPPGSGDITLDDEGNIYLTIVSGNSIYFIYSQQ